MRTATLSLLLAATLLVPACGDDDPITETNPVVLQDHSVTPALVTLQPGFEDVEVYSLISSDDDLPDTPNFLFGGSPDGAGLLKNADGTYTYLTNHEDNYAVSRVTLDETFRPVAGEYVLDSDEGRWRKCSATLATPEEHGFGPLYLTTAESDPDPVNYAIPPDASRNGGRLLPALGSWNTENIVPLPRTAYPGQTVLLLGDDDSGVSGGQIVLFVGEGTGNLDTGTLYVLARTDGNTRERDLVVGQSYEVEFRAIPNDGPLQEAEYSQLAIDAQAIQFGRVEDIDYRKSGDGREVYFNVTGQGLGGANADGSRSVQGRVYRLTMDAGDPTAGTLELILDGDDPNGPASMFQNPDNIFVGENYVYVQEDPNGYSRSPGSGDEETHDAYIYQYTISTGALRIVMEIDRREEPLYGGPQSRFGDWEYGAMLDISDIIGVEETYLINIQPHTWRGDNYAGPDGGTLRQIENQAGQTIVVRGLPR